MFLFKYRIVNVVEIWYKEICVAHCMLLYHGLPKFHVLHLEVNNKEIHNTLIHNE